MDCTFGLALLLIITCQWHSVAAQWMLGRATYYAAPEQVAKAYDPARGTGSFGILAYGACGYTNLPKGDLPFPREQYAALADASPDFPGSCGRCYEIRCKSGYVLDNDLKPIRLVYQNGSTVAFFNGDIMRPYLPSINPNVQDESGRKYPGNPTESQGLLSTQCYDPSRTIRLRIADSCPCRQVLPNGAPGVKPGGEVRRQEWCCGPVQHFDISYWGFQQLAHPVSGAMMLEYRPVDCDTGAAVPSDYISSMIYSFRGIEPGWNWFPDKAVSATLIVSGKAPTGGAATCVRLAAGGDLSFRAREANKRGQPFKGKSALHFWIDNTNAGIKVFLMSDSSSGKQYCFEELSLASADTYKTMSLGPWTNFNIPLSAFRCAGALNPDELNRLDFQNTSGEEVEFCLTGIELV